MASGAAVSDWETVSGGGDDWETVQPSTPAPAPTPTFLDNVRDTVKQYWDKVNPVTQAQGAAQMVTHPIQSAKDYGEQTGHLAQLAEDSFKKGDYATGVRHSLSYVLDGIPGLGAALDEAGNKSGAGDYKGAAADTAALATNLLLAPKAGGAALDAATEAGVTAPLRQSVQAAKAGIKAGSPQVGIGVLKAGSGALADAIAGAVTGEHYPVGTYMGLKSGYKDIASGVKNGVQASRDLVQLQGEALAAAQKAKLATANPARPAPAWQGIQPEVRPTPGQPIAIPSTLQSGKVPGGPQNIPPPAAPLPPRVPAWERLKQSLGEAAPISDAPIDIPNALPSGRVPGGVHNQELPVEQQSAPPEAPPPPVALPSPVDKFRELQKSAKATKTPELSATDQLLDGIAQGYGFKKGFKAVKDPAVQQTIRDLAAKMGQAKPETAPIAPESQSTNFYEYDPAKDPSPFGQQLATAFDRLKAKGPLLTKPDPSDGPYRFEEGSGEAPVIDSSKTRGNRPVANPGLLKPGQPEAMVDTLQKIANPTEGQKALLKQLREEIRRRGTQ